MASIGEFLGLAEVSGSSVAAATSAATLLPANGNRRGVSFYNYSEAPLFLKLGPSASTADFTVKMGSGSYYEVPLPMHTGTITGVWTTATGSVMITEFSAPATTY